MKFYVCMFLLLTCSIHANDRQPNVAMTNSVLCEADIQGLKIKSSSLRGWWYGESKDKNGWPLEQPGIQQDSSLNGIRVFIHYAEFPSAELTLRGIRYHIGNVASIFTEGMWDGVAQQKIGDSSWYGVDGWSAGLLVQSKTTCLLISCHDGDAATRKKVCEQIALKIVEKIQKGGRVVIPDGKPAVPAKTSP